ncbi:MAG: hypothetical protein ABFS42_11960 [Candidatus Krumholzibacteriota bacterium]
MRPSRIIIFFTALLLLPSGLSFAQEDNPSVPVTNLHTDAGKLGLAINNLGYFGTAFNNRFMPSAKYPLTSNVEHIYRGGIWVGARDSDGSLRVSTGAQDANGLAEGDEVREFQNWFVVEETPDGPVKKSMISWSNEQNEDNFNSNALATQHVEFAFDDYARIESGNHTPLGLLVQLRVLAWGPKHADDFVILDYAIINNNLTSQKELRDLYLGIWVDTTVGNTEQTNPYDPQAPVRWNFNDDVNGAWGPSGLVPEANTVPGDPNIWMAYERDDDGEEGLATSWIGYRLLGTNREPEPEDGVRPVSYNAWRFRGVPAKDDWYSEAGDPDNLLPGKYQLMSNGAFTVGETQEVDYSRPSNWVGLLTSGPFPYLAAGDTLRMTFAIVAGEDSLSILENSKIAQVAYNNGFSIPAGPPSPKLDFAFMDNSVVISWAPGDSLDAETGEDLPLESPLRSPEQHISDITGRKDFQGYRIYRSRGEIIQGDPFEESNLVAQYDIIDGQGFDTGLPPLNSEGKREFVDTDLLDGFPYIYSVTSFSSPSFNEGLGEFESGFFSNDRLVYPGPAPAGSDNPRTVGVYPNPYRTGSLFDNRRQEELGRKIWFTGLPARCQIQIFTLVGELVQTLYHDDPSSGQESWDLLTRYQRTVATGLYIFVVEDQDTGEIQRGKLVIIK